MHLNHINLVVPHVDTTAIFFEQYFGFTISEIKGDHMIAVLNGKGGFVLVLMSAAMNKTGPVTWPDAFHIGFLLNTPAQVQDIYDRLHNDGREPGRQPQKIRDSFGFYFHLDGIMIEVSAPLANS